MHLLTASRVRAWTACPRLHHYRYELGLAPEPGSAMAFGTAVHAGLEAWWRGEQLPTVLDRARASLGEDADAYDVARLEAMLCAYDVRYAAWASTVAVLGVEVEFSTPLREPGTGRAARTWRLAGKLDALVRLPDGRVAIVEHKTTSRDATAGTDYRRRLTLDAQVSTYFDGAEALGHRADVCLYDVLVKPSQKPLRASEEIRLRKDGTPRAGTRVSDETPEEYRARLMEAIASDPGRYLVQAEIVRTDEERAGHARDLWEVVHAIEHARTRVQVGALPARHASACFGHGSPCAFLDVCEGRASTHGFRRLPVHQELSTMTTRGDSR